MADLSQLFQLGQQVQGRLTQMQTELAGQSVTGFASAVGEKEGNNILTGGGRLIKRKQCFSDFLA